MRAVVQRVHAARVEVEGQVVGQIRAGLLVYLGAGKQDTEVVVPWMAAKIAGLRIFEDESEKMNRSVLDVRGEVLVVSQFTLYGDVRKGKRPSFDSACPPQRAEVLYEAVCASLRGLGLTVATGQFRATMQVFSQVDGPVTILVDSERAF